MVRVLSLGEGGVAVLLREEARVVVGDLDGLVFEEGVAEGEEVLDLLGRGDVSGIGMGWGGVVVGEDWEVRGGEDGTETETDFFFVLVFGANDALFALVRPHSGYVDE